MTAQLSHLDMLEAEAIHIFREAAAQFRKPVLMYSIGKDFDRPAASGAQGVLAAEATVPAAAHRHDVEVPGHDRLPRQDGARFRPRPHRAYERGRPEARHQPVRLLAVRLYRRDEDAAAEAGARQVRLRRRLRRRSPRRGKLARQGARVLVPLAGPSLGPAPSAPGDVEPAQWPSRPRRDGARVPAVELDRARRVALHPARKARGRAAVFRGPPAYHRAQRPAPRRRRRPLAAAARRGAENEERALPHAGLLAAHRRGPSKANDIESVVAETLGARTSERQGRLIDHDQAGAMERKKQEGYF